MSDATRTDGGVAEGSAGGDEPGLFDGVSPKVWSVVFYGAALLWVLALLVLASPWNWDNKFFPMLVGIPVILMLLLQMASDQFPGFFEQLRPEALEDDDDLSTEFERAKESNVSERSKSEQQRWELYMLGWVIALPILMYFVGFAWVIPIYTFALGLFFTRDVKMAVGIAFGVSLFIFLLFVVLLEVRLWEGVLGLPNPVDYIPVPDLPF
ncbi:MAG: tripartite tricarboxylate transporter TctB family protein [Haloferacaceae archaeon]